MFAAPAEGTLKDFMEFAETGFADHEQSPPNQRTHATEHYAELINRNRRYGRFRHASSLPKPHTYSLESDPPESPALRCRDALHQDRVNQNQGAESTLAFHLSRGEMTRAEAVLYSETQRLVQIEG